MSATGVSFEFDKYELNQELGKLYFYYTLRLDDGEVLNFTETLILPNPLPDFTKVSEELLNSLLSSLHLALGISYWKTYIPKELVLNSTKLSKDQAQFWNTVYTKGLGEFFYQNQIDFKGLINFPSDSSTKPTPQNINLEDRVLLPTGGGKDVVVSGEILKSNQVKFDSFSLGEAIDIQISVAKLLGGNMLSLGRVLDPKLIELNNKPEVYNGHIPITLIFHFTSILIAVLYGYKHVVFSNEHSSSYGNVEYLGEEINHQWSKSLEFEKLFQNYLSLFITPDLKVFSLLRPLYELKIAEIFSKHATYFPVFSSCNTNFRSDRKFTPSSARWCGLCAKCAFVFAILAPYVKKDELIQIFGKNLLGDENLLHTYRALLGFEPVKPWDCVGTPQETQASFYLTNKKGEYTHDIAMQTFINEIKPKIQNLETLTTQVLSLQSEHSMPDNYLEMVKNALK